MVGGALFYVLVCWGTRLRVDDFNRLNQMICKTSHVVRVELYSESGVRKEDSIQANNHTEQSLPPFPQHAGYAGGDFQ